MLDNINKKENQPETEDKSVQDIKQSAEKEDFEKHIKGLREEGKRRKIFSYLGVVVILLFATGAATATYYYWPEIVGFFSRGIARNAPTKKVACPADAKVCPDGTNVGRVPPDCEFAQCPVIEEEIDTSDLSSKALATEDWQTYQNEEYGFKFSYSNEWSVVEENGQVELSKVDNSFGKIRFLKSSASPPEITEMIIANNKTEIIDGQEAFYELYQGMTEESEDIFLLRAFVPEKDIYYQADVEESDLGELKAFYFSILDSVKFTDEIDTSSASAKALADKDWQTYRNEEYGFEFKYPKEWILSEGEINNPSNLGHEVRISFSEVGEPDYKSLVVSATEKYPNLPDFSVNASTSLKLIDGLVTQEQVFPNGWCDVLNCTEPFIGIWTSNKNYIYTFNFSNVISIEGIYNQILSTFKFLQDSDDIDELTAEQDKDIPDLIDIDSDLDGLANEQEDNYGTDPNNPDTDGDGYLDGDEVESGYNPLGEGKL